jgi:type I restriction enzyme M protein
MLHKAFDVLHKSVHRSDYHVLPALLHLASEEYTDELGTLPPEHVNLVLKDRMGRLEEGHPDRSIYYAFEHVLGRLAAHQWQELLPILAEIQAAAGRRLTPWIERAIEMVNQAGGETAGEHFQPDALTRFIMELVELPERASVYNPFAGQASFGIYLKDGAWFHGEELNERTAAIGWIRLMARGRRGGTSFGQGNSVAHWSAQHGKEDLIIANPPMGVRIDTRHAEPNRPAMLDAYFLDRAIEDVKPGGKVVAVIAGSLLFSDRLDYKRLKERMIGDDLLDMVIAFPERLLTNTNIPFYVLIINTAKEAKGQVQFVSAANYVERQAKMSPHIKVKELADAIRSGGHPGMLRSVSLDEIIQNGLDLTPKRYLGLPVEISGIPLSEILTPMPGKRLGPDERFPVVKIRDLKSSVFDYKLEMAQGEPTSKHPSARLVTASALLVALRGTNLQPTLFEYSGDAVQVVPDVGVFKVDTDKVDVQYLVMQVLGKRVGDQAESMRVGAVIPTIRTKDFLSIRMELPSLADQAKAVLREKERLLEARAAELQEFQAKLGLDKHRRSANGYLRHSIAAPLGNMRHYLQELKEHLYKAAQAGKPLNLHEGLDGESDESVAVVLGRLERRLNEVSEEVRRSGKELMDVRSVPLVNLSLLDVLEDFKRGHRSNVHTLHYSYDKAAFAGPEERKAAVIRGDRGLVEKLLHNVIDNADAHAFNKVKASGNVIDLWLTQVGSPVPSLVVRVANSGAPFPPGFTKEKYIEWAMRSGTYQGDGMGGFLVNEIVDHLGGTIDIDMKPSDKRFSTIFTFTFPITN